MYNLTLRLPQISFSAQNDDQVTPKGVASWLDELNFTNNPRTHDLFLATLRKINRTELTPAIRIAVMELLEPVARAILSEVSNKCNSTYTSPSEKQLKLSNYYQYLLYEMAISFKIIIYAIVHDEKLLAKHLGNTFAKACFYVVHFFSCLLIERYHKYLSEPSYIWFELNQIVLMAEHLGIFDLAIENGQSIMSEYLQITVIKLAEPYKLMQGEVRRIHELMASWVSYCTIESPAGKNIKQFHIVDLASQYAPSAGNIDYEREYQELRIINLDNLKTHINRQLQKTQTDPKDTSDSINSRYEKDMLIRFQKQLSYSGGKKESRASSENKMTASIGLSASYFFINGQKSFEPNKIEQTVQKMYPQKSPVIAEISSNLSLVSNSEEQQRLRKKTHINELKKINPFLSEDIMIEDNWKQIYSSSVANANIKTQAYTLDDLYQEEEWNEKNTSDGGMLLVRDSQPSGALQVGMLLAYHEPRQKKSAKDSYHLGIIRWLKINPHQSLSMGVLKLSTNCEAVAVRAIEGVGKGSEFNQALLIKRASDEDEFIDASADKKQNYLVVPSGIYNVNTVLEMWYMDTLTKVVISAKIITTKTIMQVQFQPFID